MHAKLRGHYVLSAKAHRWASRRKSCTESGMSLTTEACAACTAVVTIRLWSTVQSSTLCWLTGPQDAHLSTSSTCVDPHGGFPP